MITPEELRKLIVLGQQYRSGGIDYATFEAQALPITSKFTDQDRLNYYSITPGSIKAAVESRNATEYAQKIDQIYGLANLGVDLTQLATSFNQIRTANRASANTPQVGWPTPPGLSPQLSEALYTAQRNAADVGYAVDPALQQLNQGYQQAVQQAQSASGGQSANYQALANLANFQRMQSALGLVPAAQEARMQNQQQVNQLLGMRMQEQQNLFNNQMQVTEPAYEQFNLMQRAIGALGSQGRSYAFDALSRLPEYLTYLPYDDDSNTFIRQSYRKYQTYQNTPDITQNAYNWGMQQGLQLRQPNTPVSVLPRSPN